MSNPYPKKRKLRSILAKTLYVSRKVRSALAELNFRHLKRNLYVTPDWVTIRVYTAGKAGFSCVFPESSGQVVLKLLTKHAVVFSGEGGWNVFNLRVVDGGKYGFPLELTEELREAHNLAALEQAKLPIGVDCEFLYREVRSYSRMLKKSYQLSSVSGVL